MANGAQLPRGFDSRAFLRLALPMIVSRAGLAAMGIADGVMVARFQAHEFAWLSLAEGTLGRLLDICVSFLIGGLALVPRHFACGDVAGARWIWKRSLPVAIVLGIAGLVAGLFGGQLLPLAGQNPSLAAGAAPVMAILGAGYPLALLAITASIYMEGINRPYFVAISVAVANVLNIALNWMLIGGHLGFSAMGARGSALSTTLVRCALGLALVAYAWRWNRQAPPSELETDQAECAISRRAQWRLGAGSAITVAAMVTLTAPLTLIAGKLGVLPIAAFSAAWNLAGPVCLLALGMADAAGIYVASEAARDGVRDAAKTAWASLRRTLIPVAAAAMIFAIWAAPCAALYTRDAPLRVLLASVIPYVGVVVLIDCVSMVMVTSLRGLRETAWATAIEIVSLLLLLPLAINLALQRGYGVPGLFVAMGIVSVVRTTALVWRFLWRTRVTVPNLEEQIGELV